MNHLTRQFAKFGALSPAEQRTLLSAAVWLPIFWLGLRLLGLQRFHARLQRRPVAGGKPMNLVELRALGELVSIAARHTLGPRTCLTRSLLLGWMLRRRGMESQLRIGVRLTNGELDAHAWVECDGIPINDQHDISTQFASFGDLVPLEAFYEP